MHTIEPYYNWRHIYISEEDSLSPFYLNEYSEFEFSDKIYNHYIHPQWDNIGSPTLFIKIIYANYDLNCAIIEMIGEWNDCIHNDIMTLKRDIIDHLILNGITKFVLIGENVLNFHYSDDCYYEEYSEDFIDEIIQEYEGQPTYKPTPRPSSEYIPRADDDEDPVTEIRKYAPRFGRHSAANLTTQSRSCGQVRHASRSGSLTRA